MDYKGIPVTKQWISVSEAERLTGLTARRIREICRDDLSQRDPAQAYRYGEGWTMRADAILQIGESIKAEAEDGERIRMTDAQRSAMIRLHAKAERAFRKFGRLDQAEIAKQMRERLEQGGKAEAK